MAQHCTIIWTSRRLENIIFFHLGLEQLMLHDLKTSFIKGGLGISEVMKVKSPHLFYVPDSIDSQGHYVCHKALKSLSVYLVGIQHASKKLIVVFKSCKAHGSRHFMENSRLALLWLQDPLVHTLIHPPVYQIVNGNLDEVLGFGSMY
jgi:hypothetical protein